LLKVGGLMSTIWH